MHHLFGRDPHDRSTVPAWNAEHRANIEVGRRGFRGFELGLAVGVGYKTQFGADRFGKEFAPFLLLGKYLSIDSRDVDLLIPHWAFICDVDDANNDCLAETGNVRGSQQSKYETRNKDCADW